MSVDFVLPSVVLARIILKYGGLYISRNMRSDPFRGIRHHASPIPFPGSGTSPSDTAEQGLPLGSLWDATRRNVINREDMPKTACAADMLEVSADMLNKNTCRSAKTNPPKCHN